MPKEHESTCWTVSPRGCQAVTDQACARAIFQGVELHGFWLAAGPTSQWRSSSFAQTSDHEVREHQHLGPNVANMNPIHQFGRRLLERSAVWSCSSCRPAQAQCQGSSAGRFLSRTSRRRAPAPDQPESNVHTRARTSTPRMNRVAEEYKQRNRSTMFYTLSIILGTVAFSYGSVPMYKMVDTLFPGLYHGT